MFPSVKRKKLHKYMQLYQYTLYRKCTMTIMVFIYNQFIVKQKKKTRKKGIL